MSREEIKIGDRVRLIHSDNKFTLLKPGDLGDCVEYCDFQFNGLTKDKTSLDTVGR